jgi:hypothetical protein
MTRPTCPRCNDLGWVEEPYTPNGFKPTLRLAPCQDCNSHAVLATRGETLGLLLAFALLIALVAWVAAS